MNTDRYKVVISISHHRITYEYWNRDGENKLLPISYGNWPSPLAFYCSENGIVIGEDAERAFHNGTSNAFDGYFEYLVRDISYILGGRNRDIRFILLDASEVVFSDFFRKDLLGSVGTLSANRANMPLTFACESDIKPNERALLLGLFRDSGYSRVKVIDYDQYISKYIKEILSREYICDKVVVAWTEGKDLSLTLFNVSDGKKLDQISLEGLGIDPRMKYVEDLIWRDVTGINPWLDRNREEESLKRAATTFLSSSIPLFSGGVILSDGIDYHYSLNRSSINYVNYDDAISIKTKVDFFLRRNNIENRGRVLLLLRGLAAGNSYFENTLSPGFSNTVKSDNRLRGMTMQFLLDEEIEINPVDLVQPAITMADPKREQAINISADSIKEKKRKWRSVKAEALGKSRTGKIDVASQILKDFKSECEGLSGMDDLLSEIVEFLNKINSDNSQPIESNTEDIKSFERKWREVKASAKGKSRLGNIEEAIKILELFKSEIKNIFGCKNILDSIEEELVALYGDKHTSGSNVEVGGSIGRKGSSSSHSRIRSNPRKKEMIITQSNMPNNSVNENEGKRLINQGKLKEARDWFRNNNDNITTKLLSEIIRAQRGIEIRKSSLDEYKKSKNKEQINRIIQEIQEFIDKCKQINIDVSEYNKLLSDYKKIK